MIKLAIDLGSSVTKIFRIGSGIVLAEPSCVAVASGTNNVKAIGEEAKRLIGKTAEYTTIVSPVFEADIVNEKMAAVMLAYFLKKVGIGPSQAKRAEVVFAVPCGAQEELLDKYYRVAEECRLGNVRFAESPFLSAFGQNLILNETNPVFVIDIGGGSTDIAAFSLDGIIAGISLNIGGGNIDSHIIDKIAESFNLKIGLLTSEKIKTTIGSLYSNDNESMVVNGRDITTGRPRSVAVSSSDVYECMKVFADKIAEYAGLVLSKLPAEVSASVWHSGIYLSGGMGKLIGFDDYLYRKLQMDVNVADEPQMAVILGAGAAIGNDDLLETIRIDY